MLLHAGKGEAEPWSEAAPAADHAAEDAWGSNLISAVNFTSNYKRTITTSSERHALQLLFSLSKPNQTHRSQTTNLPLEKLQHGNIK